jgi:4-amino-4-deoxy-L-arabinose transferase-like glycosyltransferase
VYEYSGRQAAEIGRLHRWLLWLVLANLAANVATMLSPLGLLLAIPVAIPSFYIVYKLAHALRRDPAWLWSAALIVPIVSLIILLILNSQATAVLKKKGVPVGLMGASGRDLDMLEWK